MRIFYFTLISLSLTIAACKKKTKESEPETPVTPENSCVCLKENIGVEPINHALCYGFLTMTNYVNLTGDKPLSYVTTNAYFSSAAKIQVSGDGVVVVDSVLLNKEVLASVTDAANSHMYYQNNHNSWPDKQDWAVYGANGIPTFTYSADLKAPAADISLVPTSLSKSLVSSFKINDVANITRGFATIFSSNASGVNVSVILRAGSNEVCFPQEQLKLVAAGKATLIIELENLTVKEFNSKNIAFSKTVQYEKEIILNP